MIAGTETLRAKFLIIFGFLISSLGILAISSPAYSQVAPEASVTDANGVNLLSGRMQGSHSVVSIGSGNGGLGHSVSMFGNGRADSSQAYIQIRDSVSSNTYPYIVRAPGFGAVRFHANTQNPTSSTIFSEFRKNGHSLSYDGSVFTFTSSGGLIALYDSALYSDSPSAKAHATSVTDPAGHITTYTYHRMQESGDWKTYVKSIQNNLGYQVKYQDPGVGNSSIVAINNRHHYCSPTASSCAVPSNYANALVTAPFEYDEGFGIVSGTQIYSDAENQTFSEGYTAYPNGIVLHSFTNAVGGSQGAVYDNGNIQVSYKYYDGDLNNGTNIINYTTTVDNMGTASNQMDDERTVVATHSDGGIRTVVSKVVGNLILTDTNVLGQTTSYIYNTENLISSITFPRGDSVHYTYDGRGNVTEVRRKAVPGAGSPADIVTSAEYLPSCTSADFKYCNKPIWTKDARGKQTDYTYHAQSGQIATIKRPNSTPSLPRPETIVTYAQYNAKILNSAGNLVDAAPVWMIQQSQQFAGTSSEVTTTYTYDELQNLTPKTHTTSAQGLASRTVTMTYDEYGNHTAADGPLPGSADLTAKFYDKLHRQIGSIGIDPDDGGPKPRPASRTTYTGLGLVEKTESGTSTGVSEAALNSMSILRSSHNSYTDIGQLIQNHSESGSVIETLQQYKYDDRGRAECAVTRMNPSNFANPPTDACTLGASGIFGPDRIMKREYDIASRVTKTISAFGTADETEESATYYNYGPIRFAYDGNGSQTYYRYDLFNRPWITYYPKTDGSGFNINDFERNYYDAYGRLYQSRQRDGDMVIRSFDDHGRVTNLNAPGTVNDTALTYDIAGRPLSIGNGTSLSTFSYDGFGNLLSEKSATPTTVTYEYDDYGRRERMNYPGVDNFYITYDYNFSGQVTAIKQQGSYALAEYEYDDEGRRESLTRGGNSNNKTVYNYDLFSRLEDMTTDLAGASADQTLSFTYTPSGQIEKQTNSNTIYDPTTTTYNTDFIINGLNQISQKDGALFTYDAAGNLKTAQSKSYDYDYANRLTSISDQGTLTYDSLSRLKTVTSDDGDTTVFLYDGLDMIAEYDENYNLLKRYVHGSRTDAPLVEYTGIGTSDKKWLISDVRGSITGHSNAIGTSVATNSYDSHGKPNENNVGRFQYTGQVWLEELELYYYKARFYDPTLRRFLTADPIGYGAGMNMYAYVSGDPVNLTDPSGLESALICEFDGGCVPEVDEIISTASRIYHARPGTTLYFEYHFNFYVFDFLLYSPNGSSGGSNQKAEKKSRCPEYDANDNQGYGFLDKEINDDDWGTKRRGWLGTGTRLVGPWSTYNGAVQSALGLFSSGVSRNNTANEGVTIFAGNSGYYRSRISAPGFNQGNEFFPTNGGWGSGLSAVSAVSNVRSDGDFYDPRIGSETILLDRRGLEDYVERCRN